MFETMARSSGSRERAPDWTAAIERACTDPSAIRVVFQPIVDLVNVRVAGYELLSRFAGPPETSPDVWFAAAKRLGRADELEAAVLRRTLAARAELPADCFSSLNVSPHTLTSARVRAAFVGACSLEATVVEVTEQSAVDDYEVLAASLSELRARGATVPSTTPGRAMRA